MYIWGYQTPVFIPNLYGIIWVKKKKTSFLVKFFHFQGTNVHLGVPNSSFYPHRVKKTSFLVKFFHFQGTNVHLGVPNSSFYPNRVKKTSFLVKFFHFQGTNVHLGVPNSSFYPQFGRSGQKKSFLVKFFHFQGTNVHLGVPNSSFYPHRVKKNFIFSEIFPFLGNKCTFGGTKLQFLSPICTIQKKHRVKKKYFGGTFLVKKTKFFHFQGTNVHLGVPNSSFYPQFVRSGQKNLIFSEIFPFLGNKCTFGGTKLQFLSQSGQKNFIFSEIFTFLGKECTFVGTKLQFLSPIWTIGSKKIFLVKFFHFQGTNVHLGVPNSSFYPHRVKKKFIFSEIFPFLGNKCTFGGTKLQFLSPICTIRSKKTSFLVKFFHFQGTNVHLGVPNSSFYPQSGQKNFIFSEIFPFLGNKCTFGATKLQFLSPSGQKKLHFQ